MNSDIHPFFWPIHLGMLCKIGGLTLFGCGEFCMHFRDHLSSSEFGRPIAIGRLG
jgi:hypothetical protein